MNAVYWDTSALVKLYAPEPESASYRQLLIQLPQDVAICDLHRAELWYALCGKEQRSEIETGSARRLYNLFERHLEEGRYLQLPWGDDIIEGSRKVLESSLAASPPLMLRSLHGFHLGTAISSGIRTLVTADLKLREAAAALEFTILIP